MDDMEQAERLANTYADAILRLSYTYLKNTHDAQDICQTVFVKLLMEPREFKSPEHERAYILRMAANACKDLLKSPWRQRSQSLDVGLEVPAPQAGDGSVLEAVNQLPPHYRAVIYLFYYEGYQAAEIGQILGIPTATVHTRLARGLRKSGPLRFLGSPQGTTAVVLGSVLYKLCIQVAMSLGLPTNMMKLITAALFLLVLVLSGRKGEAIIHA